MSREELSDEEIIEEVDRLVALFRRGGRYSETANLRAYTALKMVVIDLRARQDDAISKAETLLVDAIAAVHRSKTTDGFDIRDMRHLAEVLIGRWPTVQQALRFYAETYSEDR